MKSKTAKNVVAIYSVVFGALGLIGSISNMADVMTYIIETTMIIMGILLLIPALQKATKGLIIASIVIYSISIFSGLIMLFIFPLLGALIFGMVGVPFAFGIVYLSRVKKENETNPIYGEATPISKPPFDIPDKLSDSTEEDQTYTRLTALNKMLSEGLITKEDYEKKKNSILNI